MTTFRFTSTAKKEFKKLDPQNQSRILSKLSAIKKHPSIFDVLEPLRNFEPASHRLRIGEYRLLVCMKESVCIVLSIGHRREIYQ